MTCAGAICFSNSIHLPPIENSKAANPVMLSPSETHLKQLASMRGCTKEVISKTPLI